VPVLVGLRPSVAGTGDFTSTTPIGTRAYCGSFFGDCPTSYPSGVAMQNLCFGFRTSLSFGTIWILRLCAVHRSVPSSWNCPRSRSSFGSPSGSSSTGDTFDS